MSEEKEIRKIGIYWNSKNEGVKYNLSHNIPGINSIRLIKDDEDLVYYLSFLLNSEQSLGDIEYNYLPHLSPHPTKFSNKIRKTIDNLFDLRNKVIDKNF